MDAQQKLRAEVGVNRQGVREHFVYWMFAADGRCLYVGMTRRPEYRWHQHRYHKPEMVASIAHKRMAGPFPLETARQLEREQQEDLEPVYDVRINSKRGRLLGLPGLPNPRPRWEGLWS